jgi:peroxiredoxin (alkyl hydroperoxide reductase subunit C)
MSSLTIGHQFPAYRLTALIGGDLSKVDAQQPGDYFTTISSDDHPGKWRVVFFWPKDFTFVCPTEIATFGKLNDEFEDREAQILGVSIDSESCTSSGVHSTRTSSGCLSRCSRIKRELAQATGPPQPGRSGARAHRFRRARGSCASPNRLESTIAALRYRCRAT